MAKENDRGVIFDIDTITKRTNGWNLELNLISWNEQLPKFDAHGAPITSIWQEA